MKQIGIFEAKTHLSALLDEVEKGGEVTITRHGKPVARLVQVDTEVTPEDMEKRRAAIAQLRNIAREIDLRVTPEEVKEWIDEGRR